MKQFILFCLLYTTLTAALFSQDFAFPPTEQRIYAITAELAGQLVRNELKTDDIPTLAKPIGTSGTDVKTLPKGHYLVARLSGEQLSWSYVNPHPYTLAAQGVDGEFNLTILDAGLQAVKNAMVTADGKPVKYSTKYRAYRRRDWRINHLQIIVGADTIYQQVAEDIGESRFRHDLKPVLQSGPVRLVLRPYYFLKSSYFYVRGVIRYGQWRMRNYPFKRLINRSIHPPKKVNGYVTTSQPQYRHGDTLKLSAYLAKPQGRPLVGDSIKLTIRSHNPSQKVLESNIGRTEKGFYATETVIPDNWPLNANYSIYFDLPGIMRREVDPAGSFKLEDYELKEYQLTVASPDSSKIAQSTYLDIKAEDINGLPLPSGELTVFLFLDRVISHTNNQDLTLPDTLYKVVLPTDNRREQRYTFPDSIFPAGYLLATRAKVKLRGPSGEYKEVERRLIVDRSYPAYPKILIKGDSVYFSLLGETEEQEGMVLGLSAGQELTDTLNVQLPFQLLIDHQLSSYQLIYGEQSRSQSLTALTPLNEKVLTWSEDTLTVNFVNHHGQAFQWELVNGTKVVAQGDENLTSFTGAGYQEGSILLLKFRYFTGGQWKIGSQSTTAPPPPLNTIHPNVLKLVLQQPPSVLPGETVLLEVTATDQQGQPATGVNLSAGSYNARFTERPFTMPGYVTKRKRKPRQRQNYSVAKLKTTRTGVPPRWLLPHFAVDTLLAYQLRYPDSTFTYQQDLDSILPAGGQRAHFAPFVLNNHRPELIHLVYVDDRLVYFYDPAITTPYSIPVDSGWHRIRLRTATHEYSRKIWFAPRQQTVVSFDGQRWVSAGWQREERKQEYSKLERQTIYQQLFALTGYNSNQTFTFRAKNQLLQSGRVTSNNQFAPLGLAEPGERLTFWLAERDSVKLTFENNALYQITKERDRLYPLPAKSLGKLITSSGKRMPQLPVYQLNDSIVSVPVYQLASKPLPRLNRRLSQGRLQFANLPKELHQLVVIRLLDKSALDAAEVTSDSTALTRKCCYFEVSQKGIHSLPPGKYQSYLVFKPDSTLTSTFTITEDALTYLIYEDTNGYELLDYESSKALGLFQESNQVMSADLPPQFIFNSGDNFGVRGKVLDATNEPLPFANVFCTESKVGVVTDIDGNFFIPGALGGDELVVTYVGYTTAKITVPPSFAVNEFITITLAEDGTALEEIVVVGYGNISRGQTVTSEEIRNLPTRDINAIAGIVAGLAVSDEGERVRVNSDESTLDNTNLPAPTVRDNFNDYAAFIPHLRTDRQGKARFAVTFPDDITAWNTFAVGQDKRRRVGLTVEQTQAFLPLQAQLYLPRFLVEGDRSEAATLAINRAAEEKKVRLVFQADEVVTKTQDTILVTSINQRFPIVAPSGKDSLSFQFSVQEIDFNSEPEAISERSAAKVANSPQTSQVLAPSGDAELRHLKVFPKGTEMVSGELFLLTENNPRVPTSFVRPERGPVTLRLPGNRLNQLLNDLNYLVDYPYGCVEQTASRLIGLLALEKINLAQGKEFEQRENAEKMVNRLEKARRIDHGYGWWPGAKESSAWISLHVYQALVQAKAAGYLVSDLAPLRQYLQATSLNLPLRDRLQITLTLAETGTPPEVALLHRFDTIAQPSDYEMLAILRLHQLRGDTIDAQRLLDSSQTHSVVGRYWGERRFRFYRQPLNDQLACGLLAQQLLSAAGEDVAASETVNYLLGQTTSPRGGNLPLMGTNTLESAKLVAGLLPYLLKDNDGQLAPPQVSIITPTGTETANVFPYETVIPAQNITTTQLVRSGSGPLPVAIYQRWFERNPTEKSDGFQLTSRLTDQRGRTLNQLTLGQTARLEVTVTVTADADYVLIEVPIPAGCSYQNRNEDKGKFAVHREYQRDRAAIFCDHLPVGQYTYTVALEPRFSGTYTLNPARAEMQYVPVVNGNGALEEVQVAGGE